MVQIEELFRNELLEGMIGIIDKEQMDKLGNVITTLLSRYKVDERSTEVGFVDATSENLRKRFIGSLRLEGKSEETLRQYNMVIELFLNEVQKDITNITTNDIRYHLATYQATRKVCNATIDNRRRILSSFFSWLTKEEYIDKNPILRISKIKSEKEIKIPFSDNDLENLRDCASNTRNPQRDRALIEFLLSTGCRVSEVVNLELSTVDFLKSECIVRKQSIEKIIKTIAKEANVDNAHPHRFRRTFATNSLNKGMPVQHLQKILGHQSLDTTMIYCQVDEDLIKFEHKKVA